MNEVPDDGSATPSRAPTPSEKIVSRLAGAIAAAELLISELVPKGKDGDLYMRLLRTRARDLAARRWSGEPLYATDSTEIVFHEWLFPAQKFPVWEPTEEALSAIRSVKVHADSRVRLMLDAYLAELRAEEGQLLEEEFPILGEDFPD